MCLLLSSTVFGFAVSSFNSLFAITSSSPPLMTIHGTNVFSPYFVSLTPKKQEQCNDAHCLHLLTDLVTEGWHYRVQYVICTYSTYLRYLNQIYPISCAPPIVPYQSKSISKLGLNYICLTSLIIIYLSTATSHQPP